MNRRTTISTLTVFFTGLLTVLPQSIHHQKGLIESLEGNAQFTRSPAPPVAAREGMPLDYGDRLRTLEYSRAAIRWEDRTILRMAEFTLLEIQPPPVTNRLGVVRLWQGAVRWFSKQKSIDLDFETPHAVGGTRGTEFELTVGADKTILRLFEGAASIGNESGELALIAGEMAIVAAGQAPQKFRIEASSIVQWWLFYPGILDPGELSFSKAERNMLAASLVAYERGDLRGALSSWPSVHPPASAPTKVYLAGLLLAAGSVEQSEALLSGLPPSDAGSVRALRMLIAAVSQQLWTDGAVPKSGSEWLAYSYLQQSRRDLPAALAAAQEATHLSPRSGLSWERLAELEFSFGRLGPAEQALQRALKLSPSNAQAHSLQGFILAAQNQVAAARESFECAIELDPGLANGWLGRGLCRFRVGDRSGTLNDLLVAAALEPNRSLLRSYLGKAFQEQGDRVRAGAELDLATRLDPKDPTPPFFQAWLAYDENRVNEAVRSLEQALAMNDNRSVYRSALMIDQDRAMRGASLARVYRRAGMSDVAVWEAARSTVYDYPNYSAHLFMAESYYGLLDPTRFNLRYYSAWFNEVLLANMLSPVDVGIISAGVSQQEYAGLFEANGLHLSSYTAAGTDGRIWQAASQQGQFSRTAYSVDVDYQHNLGVRPNNDLDRLDVSAQIKQQVGAWDTLTFMTLLEDYESGDNFQYFDPSNPRRHFRFEEEEIPILLGGWRHEWSPGIQTVALAGRLVNTQHFSDQGVPQVLVASVTNTYLLTDLIGYDVDYHNQFTIYTGELNQIGTFEELHQTFIAGARFQAGSFEADAAMASSDPLISPSLVNGIDESFSRVSIYAYDYWTVCDKLVLLAGLTYDVMEYPTNYRHPPLQAGTDHVDQISPKAAVIWSPLSSLTLRGMFSRSLSGVSLDESYRLEPPQLAGFSQSYRTVIPESLAGSVAGQQLELAAAALDFKLPGNTYLGIQGNHVFSKVDRTIGVFDLDLNYPPAVIGSTSEALRYWENSLSIAVSKLLGEAWALGTSYQFARATLERNWSEIRLATDATADLQEWKLWAIFNHDSGFFAGTEVVLLWQAAAGSQATPSESVQQVNVECGWRFRRQRGEIAIGMLNLGGGDYRLNPLSGYRELPRERVLFGRVQFSF